MDKFDLFQELGINCDIDGEDNKYSKKILAPQYLPSHNKPDIRALCNKEKFFQLKAQIMKAENISQEEKEFLIFASARHIVFNYSLIADYYAHSNKEMQKLMEDNALVIIDFEDAIANGYVKMSKNIEKIMKASGREAGEKEGE